MLIRRSKIYFCFLQRTCQNVGKWQAGIYSIFQVVSTTGKAAKSKETGINAATLVKMKAKKVDSNGTDETADKHERKTTKRCPF